MCDEEEVCCVLMDCSCQFWWKGQVAVLIADRMLKKRSACEWFGQVLLWSDCLWDLNALWDIEICLCCLIASRKQEVWLDTGRPEVWENRCTKKGVVNLHSKTAIFYKKTRNIFFAQFFFNVNPDNLLSCSSLGGLAVEKCQVKRCLGHIVRPPEGMDKSTVKCSAHYISCSQLLSN